MEQPQNEMPFAEDFGPEVGNTPVEDETKTESPDVLKEAKEYALLYDERKRLESQVETIKEKMSAIEANIAETMLFENPRVRVKIGEHPDGKGIFKTVHVSSIIRASSNGEKDKLIAAMKDCGLGVLVSESFNYNTLSAHIRGLDPDKKCTPEELLELVPEGMRPYLKLTKVLSLGCKA